MDIQIFIDSALKWISTYYLNVLGALAIFFIGKWIARRLGKLASKVLTLRSVDPTLVLFLNGIIYYALLVLVVVAAAGQLGIETNSFLTLLGAAGLAIGLALKDSLTHFASGVLLIFNKPFKVEDWVTVGGVTGKVEKITIFNTIINTADNRRIIIPNGKVSNETITNITAHPTRRVDMVVGISYSDDIVRAKEVLNELLAADPRILKEPAQRVMVLELGDSSVNLGVRPWVNAGDYWDVFWDLTEQMKAALEAAGITIPFPQRDVHMIQE